jgi:hypothetical protein
VNSVEVLRDGMKERKEKGWLGGKGRVEERTKGTVILGLGLSAVYQCCKTGVPHGDTFLFPPLQDKTRRGHHLFPTQTMR